MPETKDEPYHPHWRDPDGVVHIGNFTGPFTACGKPNMGLTRQSSTGVPATCVECINYLSRKS